MLNPLKPVLDEVLVDGNGDFNPDNFADSSSSSSSQHASERNRSARGCGISRRFPVPVIFEPFSLCSSFTDY